MGFDGAEGFWDSWVSVLNGEVGLLSLLDRLVDCGWLVEVMGGERLGFLVEQNKKYDQKRSYKLSALLLSKQDLTKKL